MMGHVFTHLHPEHFIISFLLSIQLKILPHTFSNFHTWYYPPNKVELEKILLPSTFSFCPVIEEYYRFYLEIWFYPTPQSLPVWFWFSAVCPPQTCHQSLQCCSAYHCLNCCGCFIKAAPLFFSFLRVLPLTTFQVLNCSLWIGIHVGAVGADVCI